MILENKITLPYLNYVLSFMILLLNLLGKKKKKSCLNLLIFGYVVEQKMIILI